MTTKETVAELKPCPFCGCKVRGTSNTVLGFTFTCTKCNARMWNDDLNSAMAMWNRRYSDISALQSEIESLKKQVALCKTISLMLEDHMTNKMLQSKVDALESMLKAAQQECKVAEESLGQVALQRNALQTELSDLKREIAQDKRDQWLSIESAPEATYVLVWLPNYGVQVASKTTTAQGFNWWTRAAEPDYRCYPAYWMALPKEPAIAAKKEGV